MSRPAHPTNIEEIGKRLRRIRKALGLKQVTAAQAAGVAAQRWFNWENGDRMPAVDRITVFCDRFGLTLDAIYRGHLRGLPQEMIEKLSAPEPEEED